MSRRLTVPGADGRQVCAARSQGANEGTSVAPSRPLATARAALALFLGIVPVPGGGLEPGETFGQPFERILAERSLGHQDHYCLRVQRRGGCNAFDPERCALRSST